MAEEKKTLDPNNDAEFLLLKATDNEALTSIRFANKMLRDAGMTWFQFISGVEKLQTLYTELKQRQDDRPPWEDVPGASQKKQQQQNQPPPVNSGARKAKYANQPLPYKFQVMKDFIEAAVRAGRLQLNADDQARMDTLNKWNGTPTNKQQFWLHNLYKFVESLQPQQHGPQQRPNQRRSV